MMLGNSFMIPDITEPKVGGNGNVAFPQEWSFWQTALWRFENNCPGCGWTPEEGFRQCGAPTTEGAKEADRLNAIHKQSVQKARTPDEVSSFWRRLWG